MVLEGVHLVPGMVARRRRRDGRALRRRDRGRGGARVHFQVRDAATDGLRPVDKYLDAIDDIRRIQNFIVDQARRSRAGRRERERRAGDRCRDRARARLAPSRSSARGADGDGARVSRRRPRPASSRVSALQLRVVPPRDRAGGARGRALARPRRPGERGGGGVLRDGGCARAAADHGPGRDRRRGRRAARQTDRRRSARAGRRSTSRSTRSRAAAVVARGGTDAISMIAVGARGDAVAARDVHAEDGGRPAGARLGIASSGRWATTSARSPSRTGAW